MNPFLFRLSTDVPLLMPAALAGMLATIDPSAAEPPGLKAIRERLKPTPTFTDDGLAIVPVHGPLAYKPDVFEMIFCGIEDSALVQKAIADAASNPQVRGVLVDVHSPGGMVMGGVEIADAVALSAKIKPTVAHISGLGASLGYWIASQAREVVATRSAQVGSIGTIMSFPDISEALKQRGIKMETFTNAEATLKAAGHPGNPLTEEQRAYLQGRAEQSFALFRSSVKSARPAIADEAFKGGLFFAAEAKKHGLVDRVGDPSFALSVLRSHVRRA